MHRPLFARCLFVVGILSLGSGLTWGLQEETPEKPEVAEESTETAADPQAEWAKLSARKKEIAETLASLREKFAAASVEEKRTIRSQFQTLVDEFMLELSPKMSELADEIYKLDSENAEAAEFVIQNAWRSGDYATAVKVSEQLLEAGKSSEIVLNIGGAANFAEHNFDKAAELLTKAEQMGALDPQTGGRYLDYAKEYVELWKTEQAIREKEANAPEGEQLPRVELTTNKGKIVIELFENEAPNTVANFISLVESKFYDGIKFHRVISNFMIQGGDPNTKNDDPNDDGLGGPDYTIKCECFEEGARMHFAGSLSMAHAGQDTGGSQFFITHLPTAHLNPNNGTQSNHTVFGRVIGGLDVVRDIEKDDMIEKAVVLRKRDHEYKPETTPDPNAKPSEEESSEKKDESKDE